MHSRTHVNRLKKRRPLPYNSPIYYSHIIFPFSLSSFPPFPVLYICPSSLLACNNAVNCPDIVNPGLTVTPKCCHFQGLLLLHTGTAFCGARAKCRNPAVELCGTRGADSCEVTLESFCPVRSRIRPLYLQCVAAET